MAGRECYHCKQWIEAGEAHDCWTTTEAALTRDLSDDLREAWERLRETALSFGAQRIYASHRSIMFSRRTCYFFVRPKTTHLELCMFLGRALKAPQVRSVVRASTLKLAHLLQVRHRDEVEPPITDWLREAYGLSDVLAAKSRTSGPRSAGTAAAPKKGATPASRKRKTPARQPARRGQSTGTSRRSRRARAARRASSPRGGRRR
jgi:hypothetical protein